MRNPIPRRFRRSLSNVLLMVLVYLALTGLHAMIDGRAPIPPTFLLIGFVVGSLAVVWLRGAMEEERT
ncbi:hypothetical protein [Sphingosinicella sp.]|uniref:hypothetical protein n=1 Tax=Sphingosinicella sp. TaxID=1917971 RepID=UPI004037C08E